MFYDEYEFRDGYEAIEMAKEGLRNV